MKSFCFAAVSLPIALAMAAPAHAQVILSQGFDDVSTLASSGWVITNQSNPVGETNWFQGNNGVFDSQSGAATSYIAANYNNTAPGGQIADWLISPLFSTATGGTVSFWLRGASDANFFDTIRTGFSTGSSATSAFTLSALQTAPQSGWTQFNVSFAAAGAGATGRFAIEYAGPEPTSNFIGVDTFSVTANAAAVPEPASWALMISGFGLVGGALRTSRRAVAVAA